MAFEEMSRAVVSSKCLEKRKCCRYGFVPTFSELKKAPLQTQNFVTPRILLILKLIYNRIFQLYQYVRNLINLPFEVSLFFIHVINVEMYLKKASDAQSQRQNL